MYACYKQSCTVINEIEQHEIQQFTRYSTNMCLDQKYLYDTKILILEHRLDNGLAMGHNILYCCLSLDPITLSPNHSQIGFSDHQPPRNLDELMRCCFVESMNEIQDFQSAVYCSVLMKILSIIDSVYNFQTDCSFARHTCTINSVVEIPLCRGESKCASG